MGNLYSKSNLFLDYARQWTPTAAQTMSKAPERFPVGAFPVFADEGIGARLWDIDGNEFIDWICGLASITLGYKNPKVNEAIRAQLLKGTNFSLPTRLEARVAERLCSVFPCGKDGAVRFVKTGSEANEAAIRIARRATGRDIIVTVATGYHSWHAWGASYKPYHPGVPKAFEGLVRTFAYNDLDSLTRALSNDVALVILEPTCHEQTTPEFLEGVISVAHAYGALVCFDEVVCAGRWAVGGGQEYFSVTPDFATAGKGLANGMPLACVVGPRELMKYADLVSGTFGGETLSLAAANAVLDVYESEPIIRNMWWRGGLLQEYFNNEAERLGVSAICDGYPCKPRIRFTYQSIDDIASKMAMSLFLQETAAAGTLFHPGGLNVSAALTSEDMEITYTAIERGLKAVREAIWKDDWSLLKGDIIKPVVTVRQ